jgi:ArsR family transcriptional regulator
LIEANSGRRRNQIESVGLQPRATTSHICSATDLTAGEIAARFEISKPSVSKHLSILENAGLVRGEKRGQFIHYSLVRDNLVNTLNGYVQEVCPISKPLKRESKARAAGR